MLASCEEALAKHELNFPNARPLPPLTTDECLTLLSGLMDKAAERSLSQDECFFHGQLVACYRHAVYGEALGYKGRVFVATEDDFNRILKKETREHEQNAGTSKG